MATAAIRHVRNCRPAQAPLQRNLGSACLAKWKTTCFCRVSAGQHRSRLGALHGTDATNCLRIVFGACGAASVAFAYGQGFRRASLTSLGCMPAAGSQHKDKGYRTPAPDLVDLVDSPSTPGISIDPTQRIMLFLEEPPLRTLEDLCREEKRLAGLRFDPVRRLPARASGATGLVLRPIFNGGQAVSFTEATQTRVMGLPQGSKIRSVTWHPRGKGFAFVVLPPGIDSLPQLWLVTLDWNGQVSTFPKSVQAEQLTDIGGNPLKLNGVRGSPIEWHPDGKRLLLDTVPWPEKPSPKSSGGLGIPVAPTVQESIQGRKTPALSYHDLLQTPEDEDEYEWYTTTQIVIYDVENRRGTSYGEPGMYRSYSLSPDANFMMVSKTLRPFSYAVPEARFAREVEIWGVPEFGNEAADLRRWPVARIPLRDKIPRLKDAVEDFPRLFAWRTDQAHTLRYVQALDGGDPRVPAEYRDQIFWIEGPPFNVDSGLPGPKFEMRYHSQRTTKEGLRFITEQRWKDRRERVWVFGPESMAPPNRGAEEQGRFKLHDRSYEDRYNDPGSFVTEFDPNTTCRFVKRRASDGAFFLFGSGASSKGLRPFVDVLQLPEPLLQTSELRQPQRLWRCAAGPLASDEPLEDSSKEVGGVLPQEHQRHAVYERPARLLGGEDDQPIMLLFWRESQVEPANLFVKSLENPDSEEIQLTNFSHPQPALLGVKKELVKYKRKDGVELNATLYLPPGYDSERHGRLPCLMWAYPREFKSADAAGQISSSPYSFVRGHWSRPIFWLLRGYAVFDNFAMPVVGEGNQEPNDTFIEQLRMSAEAAVDTVVNELKVVDPDRICVGGHSYGAFMTAHLLAHTDLFRAGICRSGAYNRTLTPFGFQNEERTYWESPDTYSKLSPFLYARLLADKGAPMLLIHGQDDPNVGTYPMQSERFFQALKGHGATAKLVLLPKEQHAYSARESILHVLYEQDAWLQRFNAPRTPEERESALTKAAEAAAKEKGSSSTPDGNGPKSTSTVTPTKISTSEGNGSNFTSNAVLLKTADSKL